jgi:hypothetical protein
MYFDLYRRQGLQAEMPLTFAQNALGKSPP